MRALAGARNRRPDPPAPARSARREPPRRAAPPRRAQSRGEPRWSGVLGAGALESRRGLAHSQGRFGDAAQQDRPVRADPAHARARGGLRPFDPDAWRVPARNLLRSARWTGFAPVDGGLALSRGGWTATLALTCGFLIVEVAGALWSGSLALLADAGQYARRRVWPRARLFAIWIAARPLDSEKTWAITAPRSWGRPRQRHRCLLGIAAGILVETYQRLLTPPTILGACCCRQGHRGSGRARV